jgi:hypothetical protein
MYFFGQTPLEYIHYSYIFVTNSTKGRSWGVLYNQLFGDKYHIMHDFFQTNLLLLELLVLHMDSIYT